MSPKTKPCSFCQFTSCDQLNLRVLSFFFFFHCFIGVLKKWNYSVITIITRQKAKIKGKSKKKKKSVGVNCLFVSLHRQIKTTRGRPKRALKKARSCYGVMFVRVLVRKWNTIPIRNLCWVILPRTTRCQDIWGLFWVYINGVHLTLHHMNTTAVSCFSAAVLWIRGGQIDPQSVANTVLFWVSILLVSKGSIPEISGNINTLLVLLLRRCCVYENPETVSCYNMHVTKRLKEKCLLFGKYCAYCTYCLLGFLHTVHIIYWHIISLYIIVRSLLYKWYTTPLVYYSFCKFFTFIYLFAPLLLTDNIVESNLIEIFRWLLKYIQY